MKKIIKSLLSLALCLIMVISMGCSSQPVKPIGPSYDSEEEQSFINSFNPADYPVKDSVNVVAQVCGYGVDWLKEMAKYYEKITGITVSVKESPSASQDIVNKIGGGDAPADLYFDWASSSQWNQWAAKGDIEDLTELVEQVAPIRDDIVKSTVSYNGKVYLMPFAYPPTGFVYNQNYLDQIASKGEYEQGKWPTSWQGLLDLCQATIESDLMAGGDKVQPFTMSGAVAADMNYIFKSLWAQIDYEGFRDYWEYDGRENYPSTLFNTNAVNTAMQSIRDLLQPQKAKNGKWYPANCVTGSAGFTNIQAETQFLHGASVFVISGSWFENEMSSLLDGKDFYRFGKVPLVDSSKQSVSNINLPGEHFTVPKNSKNAEGAKQFLKFILQPQSLQRIHNMIQTPLSYVYDTSTLKLNDWGKQILEAVETSKGTICWSDSKVMQSEALTIFKTDKPFVKMATKGALVPDLIEAEIAECSSRFSDFIEFIPE